MPKPILIIIWLFQMQFMYHLKELMAQIIWSTRRLVGSYFSATGHLVKNPLLDV